MNDLVGQEECRDCKQTILAPEFAYRGASLAFGGVFCATCITRRERARESGSTVLCLLGRLPGIGMLVGASTLVVDAVSDGDALGATGTAGLCAALAYPSVAYIAGWRQSKAERVSA